MAYKHRITFKFFPFNPNVQENYHSILQSSDHLFHYPVSSSITGIALMLSGFMVRHVRYHSFCHSHLFPYVFYDSFTVSLLHVYDMFTMIEDVS